ncbi:MAG: transglutaminase domain-containing protein [Clostridia bacterium]|nr:transglutaminase domain-containing protein [Clostridia bacterium]
MSEFERGMPAFDEKDFIFLAVSLPDEINYYKYRGDFAGEIEAIKKYRRGKISRAMDKRLQIELIIAREMTRNYNTGRDELLAEVREDWPEFTGEQLDRLIADGYADYILKEGGMRFSNAAAANIIKCAAPAVPGSNGSKEADFRRRGMIIAREKGYRAARIAVSLKFEVRRPAQRNGRVIRVHLPYPAITPEQSDVRLDCSTHRFKISDAEHRTAFTEAVYTPGDVFGIDYSYTIRVPYFDPDPALAKPAQGIGFVGEEYPHVRFTPLLEMTAVEIAGKERNPLILARRAYDFVTKNVVYSYMRHYLLIDNIPEYALLNRRGDCGVQALLFITLCRAMGIPARWQSGCHVTPWGVGSHDWAQFYVAPWGWMYADPSFGGGALRRGDTEGWNWYFGNLDVCRQINCTGFYRPFEPEKKFMRCDPYDNQTGEAEYDSVGLGFGETETDREVIAFEELP